MKKRTAPGKMNKISMNGERYTVAFIGECLEELHSSCAIAEEGA